MTLLTRARPVQKPIGVCEMAKQESAELNLRDLDNMSVRDLRRMLDEYPDDARVDVRVDQGWSDQDPEFFVFTWEK